MCTHIKPTRLPTKIIYSLPTFKIKLKQNIAPYDSDDYDRNTRTVSSPRDLIPRKHRCTTQQKINSRTSKYTPRHGATAITRHILRRCTNIIIYHMIHITYIRRNMQRALYSHVPGNLEYALFCKQTKYLRRLIAVPTKPNRSYYLRVRGVWAHVAGAV